jgi:hypothetical protein
MNPTHITNKKSKLHTNPTAVQLTPLETYARTATGLEVCAVLANWQAAAPAARAFPFFEIAGAVCARLDLDHMLGLYLPDEKSVQTGLVMRSKTNPECFGEALTKLLNAREELAWPLLVATLADQFSQLTGASLESCQEAVQTFLNLLNNIFLPDVLPDQHVENLRSLIWSVPAQARTVAKTVNANETEGEQR